MIVSINQNKSARDCTFSFTLRFICDIINLSLNTEVLKLKTIFTRTLTELKKSFTNFSIALILIASVSSFFAAVQIFENDFMRTSLQIMYVAASAVGLKILLLPILAQIEDYLKSTKFAKFSIARLFVKNADHALMNLKTLLVLISVAYAVFSIMTGQLFAAAFVFWFITWIALMFA